MKQKGKNNTSHKRRANVDLHLFQLCLCRVFPTIDMGIKFSGGGGGGERRRRKIIWGGTYD